MFSFLVNGVAIFVGTIVGLVFRKYIKKEVCDAVMKAVGLVVFVIGLIGLIENVVTVNIDGTISTTGTLALILCISIGTFIGELVDIDKQVNRLANFLEVKLNKGKISEGFVTSTLLFCVGSMAIIGSFESALGKPDTIYLKSMIDCVSSIALAATLGFGVGLSAVSVIVYQGLLTLLFIFFKDFMPADFITLFNTVGYVLIAALGINFLVKDKIKVANMLPALLIVIPYYLIMNLF